MSTSFSELVMRGSFSLVKGFVAGFVGSHAPTAKYFFYRQSGVIRHDSLSGLLKEFLEMEQQVYLCLEDSQIDAFSKVVEWAEPKIGIAIIEKRRIRSAALEFSFELFNKELAKQCRSIFLNAPPDVEFLSFQPVEVFDEKAPGIAFTSRVQTYRYEGSGTARGSFEGITELFLKCKRSPCADFIKCEHITLDFQEEQG